MSDYAPTVASAAIIAHARQQQERVDATLALHHPDPICAAHHVTISPTHTCDGPHLYRCASCARTAPQPCRTWRTLTGKDSTDA